MTFTLDEIERVLDRESQYIQQYELRYYLDGMRPIPYIDKRDMYTEGVVRGLRKAVEFLREEERARTVKLT